MNIQSLPVIVRPVTVRQGLYKLGITIWQNAKKRIPFLNNYSHFVGNIAFKVFPPPAEEVVAAVPWNLSETISVPSQSPSSRTYLSQRYELEVVERMSEILQRGPGTMGVDVGAHVGYFSKLMADKLGQGGSVWAFEPNPISYRYLQENLHSKCSHPLPYSVSNQCSNAAAVTLVNRAAGEAKGTGYLEDPEYLERGMIKTSGAFEVAVMPLDYYLASKTAKIAVIKIDTDGFEAKVLRGAKKVLAMHQETSLIIEHQALPENDAYEAIRAELMSYGFNRYEALERGTWHDIKDPFPYPTHHIVYNLYFPPRDQE